MREEHKNYIKSLQQQSDSLKMTRQTIQSLRNLYCIIFERERKSRERNKERLRENMKLVGW